MLCRHQRESAECEFFGLAALELARLLPTGRKKSQKTQKCAMQMPEGKPGKRVLYLVVNAESAEIQTPLTMR